MPLRIERNAPKYKFQLCASWFYGFILAFALCPCLYEDYKAQQLMTILPFPRLTQLSNVFSF